MIGTFRSARSCRVLPCVIGTFSFSQARAIKVGTGKCGRHGNGTGRQRESRVIFRSRRRFPDRSLRWLLFPPSAVPTYGVLFPSRDRFPFNSLPSCSRHPPSRRSPHSFSHLLGQLQQYFHSMLPPAFSFFHRMNMDATGLSKFGCNNTTETMLL